MRTTVEELNIVICGVGGQGVVLMSELLGRAAVRDELSIRGSEVLGMAQRGGSVISDIRIGSELHAPLIPEGRCDIMVALEPSEALRYIKYLSESSLVLLNTRKIIPFIVSIDKSVYPELEIIMKKLGKVTDNVITIDASQIAEEAGSPLSTNVVMLGALLGIGRIPVDAETVKAVIRERLPAGTIAANIRAFDLGYATVNGLLES
jgi:indolepyruvate ferredoxin oxidoreductase beta subunit